MFEAMTPIFFLLRGHDTNIRILSIYQLSYTNNLIQTFKFLFTNTLLLTCHWWISLFPSSSFTSQVTLFLSVSLRCMFSLLNTICNSYTSKEPWNSSIFIVSKTFGILQLQLQCSQIEVWVILWSHHFIFEILTTCLHQIGKHLDPKK